MSARAQLAEIIDEIKTDGSKDTDEYIEKILAAFPDIDDHEGEAGGWMTTDEWGNLDGPYETRADAMTMGAGNFTYWAEED